MKLQRQRICLSLVVLIFSLCSCGTAPVDKKRSARRPASAKPTRDAKPPSPQAVELIPHVLYSSRRAHELESGFLLDKGVQDCLRAGFSAVPPETVAIDIEGLITYSGQTEALRVETASTPLKTCLEGRLGQVKHGRGIQGPFKLQIQAAPADGSVKGKGLILELNTVKKFE